MESDFLWSILNISLTTSFVIGLLLLLMPSLRKRYPSKWRYYMWLIIAVRLLTPFNITFHQIAVNIPVPETVKPVTAPAVTFQGDEPAATVLPDEKHEVTEISDTSAPYQAEKSTPFKQTEIPRVTEQSAAFSISKLVRGIWILGMVVFILLQTVAYILFLRKLHYSPRQETASNIRNMLLEVGKELGIAQLPEIRVCRAAPAPILTGLFRPVLLLPHNKYSEQELAFILRHELVHYRRRDLWYKLVLTIAKLIHWFNPLVWLMAAQADKDVEISCDDLVMDGLSDDDRTFYGNAILNTLPIKSKWRLEPVFTTSFGSTKANMKQRLKNLFDRSAKKKGVVAFCAVLLIVGFIGGTVAFMPAIAAGNENPRTLPANTVFTDNDNGDSRVVLGPYALKKQETCTVTIIWEEGGAQTLYFIKETPDGKDSTARTEHTIRSREPLTITAWEDGNYRFVIPAGKSMTGIVCVVDYAGADDSGKVNDDKEFVTFDEVELRTNESGAIYIHDILSNQTGRNIVAYERGMLAFDKNGQPLKIKWFAFDSDRLPTYSFLYDYGRDNILAGTTKDISGGWSLSGGIGASLPAPTPNVNDIEYVLYNLKQITFSDGTMWVNPDYENWLKTYEGKQTDVDILKGYYPSVMEILSSDMVSTGVTKNHSTTNTDSILKAYHSAQNSRAFKMFNKNIFANLADDWAAEIGGIENPVWNYDSFTQYQILDHNLLSVTHYKDLYYCTFSADNDKFGYIVVAYDGSSLQKISIVETPYLYDLQANIDEITDCLSGTEIDLSTAVALRVKLVDTERNRSDEIILFTDDSGNNYVCYLGASSFELVKLS